VEITGAGWWPGESVKLQVLHDGQPADNNLSTSHQPWSATADADGIINTTWAVPPDEDELGATLRLTADGESSTFRAEVLFTDAAGDPPTNPSPQSLPYSQDFSSLPHTSTTYPAGWQGWRLAGGSSSSFRTNAPTADEVLLASSSASTTTTGVQNDNGKIGFLAGTSTVDPSLALAVNTTGQTNIVVAFEIMTIRNPYSGTTNTRINKADLQYRVGTTGAFTSVTGDPNGIYENNTTLQTGSGVTTPQNVQSKSYTLPSLVDNQPVVQLRWVQRDATGGGSRPSFAVDNINVRGTIGTRTSASDASILYGSTSVTLSATIVPSPTGGTVLFYVDGRLVGSGSVVAGGATASFVPNFLDAGKRIIKADFSGCESYAASSSDPTSNGTLTVNKASSTTTTLGADPFTYDGHTHEGGSGTASGAGTITGSATLTYTGDRVKVGTYYVTAHYAGDANHVGSDGDAVPIEIVAMSLTGSFTANDKTYDGNTSATVSGTSLNGVVEGDDVSLTGGVATFEEANAGVGKLVTLTGASLIGRDACNYSLGSVGAGRATIDKATATLSVNGYDVTYDGSSHTATGRATGVGGSTDVLIGLNLTGTTHTGAGTFEADTWTFTDVTGNYREASGTVADHISKARAAVTLNDLTQTYNGSALTPSVSTTPSGLTIEWTNAPKTTVGSYALTATVNDDNYVGSAEGTFEITKATASVTPNAKSKIYGTIDPALSGTLNGFATVDNVSATYSRTAGETVGGSPYIISATLSPAEVLGNYAITYNTASFSIDKASASVTPNAANKTYGESDPVFTGTLVGFLAEDAVVASYGRAPGETVFDGPYKISASLSPAEVLSNYAITYNVASFTISRAALTITANSFARQYSDPNPPFTGVIAGLKNGDAITATYTTAANSGSPIGDYDIVPTFVDPSNRLGNYDATMVNGKLSVNNEDASIAYNGQTYFGAQLQGGNYKAAVSLSALVEDFDIYYPGDIRNARVNFSGSPYDNVEVGLIDPTVTTVGQGVVTGWQHILTNGEVSSGGKVFDVTPILSGWYRGSQSGPTTITIAISGADNVAGGGFILLPTSGSLSNGAFAGDAGSKMNFGATMKWNKSGKNLQGQINIVFRKIEGGMRRVYQIKSNAINSLSVVDVPSAGRQATINTKAELREVTDPMNPVAWHGNHDLTLVLFESSSNSTGALDRISVRLVNPSTRTSPSLAAGLLFTNSLSGSNSVQQLLGGGKIQIRSGSALAKGATSKDFVLPTEFALHQNYPNPFNPTTTIAFEVPEPSTVSLTVYDLLGRRIQTIVKEQFEPGTYYQQWNGRDESGNVVPSGVYVLRIYARSITSDRELSSAKKMLLMK
jgi:hypothetical protein